VLADGLGHWTQDHADTPFLRCLSLFTGFVTGGQVNIAGWRPQRGQG